LLHVSNNKLPYDFIAARHYISQTKWRVMKSGSTITIERAPRAEAFHAGTKKKPRATGARGFEFWNQANA
jgi:hypothetical protein